MKLTMVTGGLLVMALAMPVAMAQQDTGHQFRDQFMTQADQRMLQQMEQHRLRIEQHQQNRYRYQEKSRNRFADKQAGGFGMNGGRGQRR